MNDKKNGSSISMDQQRMIMLDIMYKLVAYFDRHGLRYCLVGGTLIGAVRHKGFIPWDDDMDIGMPNTDYIRFIELTKSDPVDPDVFVSSVYTNPDHIWPMTKAISRKTYLIEPGLLDKYQSLQESYGGVYVDIFPIYGVPDDMEQRRKFCKQVVDLYSSFKHATRKVVFKAGYGSAIRKAAYEVAFIPYRALGARFFLNKIVALTEKYPLGATQNAAFAIGIVKNMKDVNPNDVYTEVMDATFENLRLKIPQKYDEMLSHQFGNYMELPPESERRVHTRVVVYR